MTRETKIGLLVGLAFIIVVAILLTDHAATTTDPKPAPLSEAGSNVRQSVATPVVAETPRGADTPRSPVPTRAELNTPPPGNGPAVNRVQVGPGERRVPIEMPPIEITREPAGAGPAGNGPVAVGPVGRNPNDLVSQHPEDLIPVGPNGKPATPPSGSAVTPNGTKPAPPLTAPRTYVAEAGDSVSRIAAKTMGSGNKANCDALIKANPSLQSEGNVVYVGRTYVIPSAGAAAQAPEGSRPAPQSPTPFPAPPASIANTTWYTVKDNDNLYRIASRELGDGNLWPAIRDLNRDILKGGETVRANMRIRLPKPGATASVN